MKSVKLFKPYMTWQARINAFRVLMGDMIGEGPVVKQFENEFLTKTGLHDSNYAVAVNSGTSALELAYELAGIGPGDEVITPVLTCTATNIPLLHRGAKIIFADVDKDLNIDVEDVKRKITDKTKAIVFVHFGGNNRGIVDINNIARRTLRRYDIPVIEDAAQAVGSTVWGISKYTAVSFQAIKNLTTVDGGMLLCREKEAADKARRLRWFGYDRDLKHKNGDTDLTEAGYKYHMNDLTAAIGMGNLKSLHKLVQHREKLAKIYSEYDITGHAWLATGLLNVGTDPDAFRLRMAYEGIDVGQHHFRNDKYSIFKEFKTDVPTMDSLENRYMFFPYHYRVTEKDAHKIGKLFLKLR